jgi:hypothetical protein
MHVGRALQKEKTEVYVADGMVDIFVLPAPPPPDEPASAAAVRCMEPAQ